MRSIKTTLPHPATRSIVGRQRRGHPVLRGASKLVRGLRQGLTEEERYRVADHAVAQLRERDDPWHLNDELSNTARRRLMGPSDGYFDGGFAGGEVPSDPGIPSPVQPAGHKRSLLALGNRP
jgi:hypothetical protein